MMPIWGVSKKSKQIGVSLLEALAALVILSMGAAAALTWFIGSTDRVAKLRAEESALMSKMEALEYIRSINPMLQEQGSAWLGQQQVSWKTKRLGNTVRSMGKQASLGPFEMALYEVEVKIRHSDSVQTNQNFLLQLPGYKKVESDNAGLNSIFGNK